MLLTYEAEIDEQGVIRLSDFIRFPRRRVIVTVLDEYVDEPQEVEDSPNSMVDVLRELAGSVEAPADWSAEHDHYLYGTPKRSESS